MKSSSAQRHHRWIQAGPGMPCQRYAASYETAGNDDQKDVWLQVSPSWLFVLPGNLLAQAPVADWPEAEGEVSNMSDSRDLPFALGAQPRIGHCKLFCNLKSI